jgi:hypothetical protein
MTLHLLKVRRHSFETKLKLCLVLPAVVVASATMLAQETSRVIPYPAVQTTLLDGPAQPLTLELWDTPTGGTTPRFSETQTLDVTAGQISFYLGAATPSGLNPADFQSGASRFLDVKDSTGTTVLSARLSLTAVAFALSPGPAGPQGPPGTGTVNSVGSGTGLVGGPITSAGTLSLDTSFLNARYPQLTTPNTFASDQNINGNLNFSGNGAAGGTFSANGVIGISPLGRGVYGRSGGASSTTAGIFGENTASGGSGVVGVGLNTSSAGVAGIADNANGTGLYGRGTTYGVFGVSSLGRGVYGTSGGASSTTAGIFGENTASGGTGVVGAGLNTNSAGVAGVADNTNSTGVYGRGTATGVSGNSTTGRGVFGGSATASSTIAGVWGENSAFAGTGVVGNATNTNGAGVAGIADPFGGTGVYARGAANGVSGNSTSGNGVYGGSSSGYGVFGQSTSNNGIYGTTNDPSSSGVYGQNFQICCVFGAGVTGVGATGVHGISAAAGYAGYFDGKVTVTTDLHVIGTKNFKIDHPLDPANKYLIHASIESPDVKNLYDGTTTTDANGDATVILPSYFEALNRDFRYQLTVLGVFAQAIVASEIADNRFTIKTDKPEVKVSWQVTGVRQDAYMTAHPMVVEQDKPENERGTYQHPELYGQPEELGLSWVNDPALMKRLKEERIKREAAPSPSVIRN